MARPTKQQIADIIKTKAKNLAVVDKPPVRAKPAEAGTPDVAALRKKWIGQAAADAEQELDEEDLASVTLEPKNESGVDQGAKHAKEAVVSGSTKEIVGKQG